MLVILCFFSKTTSKKQTTPPRSLQKRRAFHQMFNCFFYYYKSTWRQIFSPWRRSCGRHCICCRGRQGVSQPTKSWESSPWRHTGSKPQHHVSYGFITWKEMELFIHPLFFLFFLKVLDVQQKQTGSISLKQMMDGLNKVLINSISVSESQLTVLSLMKKIHLMHRVFQKN